MANEFLKKLASKAFPTVLFVGSILVLYFFTGIFDRAEQVLTPTPTPTATILPSEFPDYEAYKSMEKRLVIAENRESYSPKNQPKVGRLTKQLTTSGQFSRIYIYIEASVDNGKPLSQWDSIYMAMGSEGGHLFRPHSLKFPGDTITRLLYGLNQIPVISLPYSENKIPAALNWFDNFTNNSVIKFDTFLSSLRVGGKINSIELRYECEGDSECEI